MFLKQGLVALLAFCPVSAAWAVPATEEGAARLRGVFQTYFGGTEGVVSVTPQGESYELKIDPAPLLAQVPAEQAQISVSALTYRLTDNGDGSWGVSEDQVLSWSVVVPKMFEQKGSTRIESTGTWDESLMSFREQQAVMTDYVIDSVQYAPPLPPPASEPGAEPAPEQAPEEPQVASRDHQRTARMEMSLSGTAGKAGGVDQAMSFTAEELEQTQEIVMGPGGQPMQISITAPGYDGSGRITGARTEGVLSLLAWFVAHPSQELIKGSQETLRDRVSAAMPLWDDLSMDAAVRDLKVGTPLGEFGLASARVMVGMSGVTADGRLQEQVALSGLSVPEGVLPSWVTPILPQEVTLDFTASEFDLAAPAKMLIEAVDLTAEDPFAKLDPTQLQAALLPQGKAALTLAPSQIKGDGYRIDYRAAIAVGADAPPNGSALISATGLDKVEAALAAAPQEQAGQPLMMLRMARAMAKPGASGENVWDIQMPEGGGPVTVNGQPMGPATSQP
ncbi:hypothetical protein [Paracoccus binzhouensis]|uniref:hypothetical protein n=1 Tax=Paracoccus binzhouensis TaxID=2796149 RepID=UPI0018EEFDE6|nr:hypothetical protein [Paracoccus binzhouensis]